MDGVGASAETSDSDRWGSAAGAAAAVAPPVQRSGCRCTQQSAVLVRSTLRRSVSCHNSVPVAGAIVLPNKSLQRMRGPPGLPVVSACAIFASRGTWLPRTAELGSFGGTHVIP